MVRKLLTHIFEKAIDSAFGRDAVFDPCIQLATKPEFGDYQANFAMKLSKILKKNPLQTAQTIIDQLQNDPIFASISTAGPGFINFTLSDRFLEESLKKLINDERLGVELAPEPQNVVVDYANANVAKEMHVGHIRSIVIGDAIVRLLNFLGHNTVRQSHLGDWGTQFGMLIEYLFDIGKAHDVYALPDLDSLYKLSKKKFDEDNSFAERARQRVVALQTGDEETLVIWRKLVKESLSYFQEIYSKLDVLLLEEDARGESFYNDMLPGVISELERIGIAANSDGAKVIFLEGFPIPFLIRKKDGGYLYASTDLAAAKYRIETLKANRIIYLTDARQKQHFAMLFAALNKANWSSHVRMEHIAFGAILGPDNRPFKTRSGESIRLVALLEEAVNRAKQIAQEKNPNLTEQGLQEISHAIGIGALKYADLRADKIKDYVFDWDKLLAFDGNTAPYLQNAYVRIQAIFRKGKVDLVTLRAANFENFKLTMPIEHALAIKLIELPSLIYSVAEDLALHRMCEYLYDLAATFHQFYERCPILNHEDENIKLTRLLLADITARTLQKGLTLLGIKTIDQM